MKLKDIVSVAYNKKNNQVNLSVKKMKLKNCDMNVSDILNLKIKEKKKW